MADRIRPLNEPNGVNPRAAAEKRVAGLVRWKISLLCLAGLSMEMLSGVARANPAQPEPAVRFTVFSTQTITGLGFLPWEGAAFQPVVFYPTTRSPRYEYRGAKPLRFYSTVSAAVVAEVLIPPEMTEALLLFEPRALAGPDALRYRIHVLEDGKITGGRGSLSVVNFSGMELAGTLGGRKIILKAGVNPPHQMGRSAKVMFRALQNSVSYQAYAGTLSLQEEERALLLLFPPYYPGSVEVQSRLLIDEVGRERAWKR